MEERQIFDVGTVSLIEEWKLDSSFSGWDLMNTG